MKRTLIIAFTAAALTAAASFGVTAPQAKTTPQTQAAPRSDIPADLAKQAKITLEAARATALAKVPGGTVKSEELEREHGKLIYSFDIQVPGKSGVEEVNVSAITGKVLAKKHESARTEKKEEAPPKPHKP